MPELAEVETVRRTLKKRILNKKIIDVNIRYSKIVETNLDDFSKILIGNSFKDIKRIGKWLIFELDNYYLLSHLRMEGKYFVKDSNDEIVKHEHIIISFHDKTDLRYHDTRKFGRMLLVKSEELKYIDVIKKQGIEANSDLLNGDYIYENIHNKNIPIKTLLLDQTIISGLGNIYANEVLFASKINPNSLGKDISLDTCKLIAKSSKTIIDEAIKEGGTTIKSYTSSLGVIGNYQTKLMVHKKEGIPCKICNTPIKKIKIGGRSTYYCPKCQIDV